MNTNDSQNIRDSLRDLLRELDSIPRDLTSFDPAEYIELCFEEAERSRFRPDRKFQDIIQATLLDFQTWKKIKDLETEINRRQKLKFLAMSGRRVQQRIAMVFASVPVVALFYAFQLPQVKEMRDSGNASYSLLFASMVASTQFISAALFRFSKLVSNILYNSVRAYESLDVAREKALDAKYYLAQFLNGLGSLLVIYVVCMGFAFFDRNTPWGLFHITNNPSLHAIGDLGSLALFLIPWLGWEFTSWIKVCLGLKGNRGSVWSWLN